MDAEKVGRGRARQDLMGRDITLLVIYPFVFGWLLLWWNNKRKAKG